MKTADQLESESVAAHKAHDAACDRLDEVRAIRKLLSDLEEALTSPRITADDVAACASVRISGAWIELGRTIMFLEVESRRLEDVAHDAQRAFVATWEAA